MACLVESDCEHCPSLGAFGCAISINMSNMNAMTYFGWKIKSIHKHKPVFPLSFCRKSVVISGKGTFEGVFQSHTISGMNLVTTHKKKNSVEHSWEDKRSDSSLLHPVYCNNCRLLVS